MAQSATNETALQYLHIPWQASVRCTDLISAVEDTCVAYQWSLTALGGVSQLVVACLSHSSGKPLWLQVTAVHLPGALRCRNIPLCAGLWPKCGLDCALHTPELKVASLILTLALPTLQPTENKPSSPGPKKNFHRIFKKKDPKT